MGTLEASRAVLAPGPMAGQGVQGVSDERPTDLTEDRPVGLSEPKVKKLSKMRNKTGRWGGTYCLVQVFCHVT